MRGGGIVWYWLWMVQLSPKTAQNSPLNEFTSVRDNKASSCEGAAERMRQSSVYCYCLHDGTNRDIKQNPLSFNWQLKSAAALFDQTLGDIISLLHWCYSSGHIWTASRRLQEKLGRTLLRPRRAVRTGTTGGTRVRTRVARRKFSFLEGFKIWVWILWPVCAKRPLNNGHLASLFTKRQHREEENKAVRDCS